MTARADITLDDKYRTDADLVLASGVQALVRLMISQAERDRQAGLNTRGYVSGYRGSPLGGVDMEMTGAKTALDAAGVTFEYGLNEDLAATAVWGTQQLDAFGPKSVDGVFALWYGKGPGVDRSGDPFKHGNRSGASKHGGVVLAFGDDHAGKSSTVAHQSDHAIAANQMPVLYPANVQEVVEYGLMGFALSRFSGLWVGLKLTNETAETTATIDLSSIPAPRAPNHAEFPPEGVNFRPGFTPQRDEVLINRWKLPLAKAFARANGLDRVTHGQASAPLVVVTAGKSWVDVGQALAMLGIGPDSDLVRVYKIGMSWPLDGEALDAAVGSAREVLVIEEKAAFLEEQVARALINREPRVRVTGKTDETGAALVSSELQLEPRAVAEAIAARLGALGLSPPRPLAARVVSRVDPATPARSPYFCSGCPHNTSTRVPEGSAAMGGIGCHTMALFMNRDTLPPTQMGGEGANWIGARNYVERDHMFQNLGDGTYTHSGILAIRAAVAARANITYKILYNDAVAMTGGQPVEGAPTVERIARQVLAEGARRVVVVSDNPEPHRGLKKALGVEAFHRRELDDVQKTLREIPGVTALIYDQTCAAEKRRRRKRGLYPDPDRRIFINPEVCEGCGDCSVKSNCVSVMPLETPLGRKREIDQSSCNKDFSCVEGFCPSFVSVKGAKPRKVDWRAAVKGLAAPAEPAASARVASDEPWAALITGIGGTGVVTIGAVLAMAAHLEGRKAGTYNMTGLAQKGGAVFSHLRIAPKDAALSTPRVGPGEADLILGCDLVTAGGAEAVSSVRPGRTRLVLNSHLQPTAAFQRDRDFRLSGEVLRDNLVTAAGPAGAGAVFETDATRTAQALFGDTIAANMFMVGAAWQAGALPLEARSIEAAIRLNGAAVELNLAAFLTGRLAVADPGVIAALAGEPAAKAGPMTLDEMIAHRTALLTKYQDAGYAAKYRAFVDQVRAAEAAAVPGSTAFTEAVAKNLAKLMAYKDEYEVARLHSDPGFAARLAKAFEGDLKITWHLAPPMMGAAKRDFGPWMAPVFKTLAKLKGLRGTPLDPFGWTHERRTERQLIADYRQSIEAALPRLTPATLAAAADLASYPEDIRGYGPVKAASIPKAMARRDRALELLHS